MPVMKGLLAPQNTFLDTIATRFDGTRKFPPQLLFEPLFISPFNCSNDSINPVALIKGGGS